MVNYEYAETTNKGIEPTGQGWEYWSDLITPEEQVAVWRRDADIYGEVEVEQ